MFAEQTRHPHNESNELTTLECYTLLGVRINSERRLESLPCRMGRFSMWTSPFTASLNSAVEWSLIPQPFPVAPTMRRSSHPWTAAASANRALLSFQPPCPRLTTDSPA